MDIFTGQNLLEFFDRFKRDDDCKEYLAEIKAQTPFKCTRCNHTACQTRSDYSRQCNICRHTESATAETLFHKVKFFVLKYQFQLKAYLYLKRMFVIQFKEKRLDYLYVKYEKQ